MSRRTLLLPIETVPKPQGLEQFQLFFYIPDLRLLHSLHNIWLYHKFIHTIFVNTRRVARDHDYRVCFCQMRTHNQSSLFQNVRFWNSLNPPGKR
jgi:hypothetical protein